MKKSLISAIKKLLTKLGAEEIEGNNLVEVIDSGADAIEGGGGSGGVEPVIVTVTTTSSTEGTWSGATWEELLNAYMHDVAGIKIPISETVAEYMWLIGMTNYPGQESIYAKALIGNVVLHSDGTVTIEA